MKLNIVQNEYGSITDESKARPIRPQTIRIKLIRKIKDTMEYKIEELKDVKLLKSQTTINLEGTVLDQVDLQKEEVAVLLDSNH